MNDDLVKAGVYNSLIQKQITALTWIGNSAAHGKRDEYTIDQIKDILKKERYSSLINAIMIKEANYE